MEKKQQNGRKDEQSLRDLWNIIKHTNVHLMGVPEEEERKR